MDLMDNCFSYKIYAICEDLGMIKQELTCVKWTYAFFRSDKPDYQTADTTIFWRTRLILLVYYIPILYALPFLITLNTKKFKY
jgi:hypothetical protein